ncbi:fucose 4-O-acetylase-like acetyltransferase [Actimicrobium sp. GrIS 1.19]|uniref:acyltransferase family protein n=1 Tax=Actimicrobium sp. GrIS 1.19 TaxID=3071708 RepID=UPI002DFA1486|nr:fucose 4-O-acetylase-like acetyltransferase [Actimicrobium sp. GrIS 1.19]
MHGFLTEIEPRVECCNLTIIYINPAHRRASEEVTLRERLWDYARGIGIVLVVYGHVLRGLHTSGIVPDGHWLMATDYPLYTFHMPLFFVLAGMNAGKGLAKDGFLRSKLMTIVYPYFLWSSLQGITQVAMAGSTNSPFDMSELATSILFGQFGQFWFLYALMLCHVFVFLTSANRLRVSAFALVAYAVGCYFELGSLSTALKFFIFYAAGLLAAEHLKSVVERTAHPLGIGLAVAGAGLTMLGAAQVAGYSDPLALPAAFLGILFVLQLSAVLARAGSMRMVERLGLASMPIFLMHILASSGTRIILSKAGITYIYLQLALGLAAGVVLPMAAYYLIYLTGKEKFVGFTRGGAAFSATRYV